MSSSSDNALAGFIQGFAGSLGNSLTNRDQEERELKKARMLEEMRAATQERIMERQEQLQAKRTSKEFSSLEGNEFVYRDSSGAEKSRRAASADEIEARDTGRKKNDLDLRQGEQSISASQAQIRQGDERNALARRGQDLDAAASRERNAIMRSNATSKQADAGPLGQGTSATIGYQLTDLNKDSVEQAAKDGVPRERIQRLASIVAAQQLAKGNKNPSVINDEFLKALSELRRGIEGTGTEAQWSLSTYEKNTGRKGIN